MTNHEPMTHRAHRIHSEQLCQELNNTLHDIKAKDITVLRVRELTSIADYLVICCGTSTRHLNAIAGKVEDRVRELGVCVNGKEGEPASEWMLIDLADVIVHVMTREARDYYQLEKLWDPNWAGAVRQIPRTDSEFVET